MNGQQLKNSILQMAIQGKLVPQDPNDEPASVLLERIRKEKEKLIKEGKIKKEKNPSYIFRGADNLPYEKVGNNEPVCIADEVPFDIPDNWEWIHPTDIGYFSSGKTPKPNQLVRSGTIPYFKVADMNSIGNETILQYSNNYLKMPHSYKLFSKGSIVYPKNGGAVFTNKKRILGQDSLIDLNSGCYTSFSQIDEWYLFYLFSTLDFQKYYKGTALPTVDMESVKKIVWGLPPLAEQKRIVKAIEKVLPHIKDYEEKHNQLSLIQSSFPEAIKKSILQEAIQGKLVPQDPNDEPASVLLERIRAKKQQLIKEGKIKKDKHESIIFRRDNSYYEKRGSIEVCIDEEIPFEIPNSWEWTRLNNICTKLVDGDHNPPKGSLTKTKYIMASSTNINNDTLVEMEKVRYLTKEIFEKENERTRVEKGDIFFTSVGSLGRTCVYTGGLNISFQRSVSVITTSIFNYYLKYCLDSEYIQQKIKRDATGTAQKGFYLNQLSKLLIPIPPEKEQHRIFDALNHIFSMISAL